MIVRKIQEDPIRYHQNRKRHFREEEKIRNILMKAHLSRASPINWNTSIDILRHRRSLLIITISSGMIQKRDDQEYIHSHSSLSILSTIAFKSRSNSFQLVLSSFVASWMRVTMARKLSSLLLSLWLWLIFTDDRSIVHSSWIDGFRVVRCCT